MAFGADPPNYVQDAPGLEEQEDGFVDIGVLDQPESRTSPSSCISSRFGSTLPKSRPASPSHSPRLGPSRLSNAEKPFSYSPYDSSSSFFKVFNFLGNEKQQLKSKQRGRRKESRVWYAKRRVKWLVALIGLLGFFVLVNWMMLLRLPYNGVDSNDGSKEKDSSDSVTVTVRVCVFGL